MHKLISMGRGPASSADCFDLVSDLMKAFEDMSGIQQGSGHYEYEPTKEDLRKEREMLDSAQDRIDFTAAKIFMSLTGYDNFRQLVVLARDARKKTK